MKKATSSFLILFFAALLVSFQSFAQMNDVVSERVQQTLRRQERLRLSDLLRLSPQEQREMEILSLSLMAQSFQGPSTLEILQQGRSLTTPQTIRRQLKEVKVILPARTSLEGIEILAQDEIFIESVTAEVVRGRPLPTPTPSPYPTPYPPTYPQPERRPVPNQMINLQVMQDVRMQQEIPLDTLVRQQMGLTLAGAEIQRVIVQAQPLGYGRAASVQLVLNGRLVGEEKFISGQRLPILVQTYEEVRTLGLLVRGDARIHTVSIRVGQVRAQPEQPQRPQVQRVLVNQEINSRSALELSRVLPYENRLARAITVEARSRSGAQAEVALTTAYEVLGTLIVSQVPMRPVIRLLRPTSLQELRLQSYSQVLIDALEIELEPSYRY